MRRYLLLVIAAIVAGAPATVWSQSAQEIIEKSMAMDAARKQGVSDYIVDQTSIGGNALLYYEKLEGVGPNGLPQSAFRLVMPDEIARRQSNGAAMSPEQVKLFARGIEALGGQVEGATGGSGLTGSLATFVQAAATAEDNKDDGSADAMTEAQQMAKFAAVADLVGTESIDGRRAFHVRADDLNYSQTVEDGQEFIVNTVSLWIDTDQYVTLKMRMDGVVLADGQSRKMYLEKVDTDYRPVGPLYESYKQTMRLGGILSPEQRAEMAQSQAQLADFDAQLASMPASQRAAMEKMVGSQIETLRNMVSGGGVQIETIVNEIRVNAGLPNPLEMGVRAMQMPSQGVSMSSISGSGQSTAGRASMSGASVSGASMSGASMSGASMSGGPPRSANAGLTQSIQRDLATLGYNPGNSNGEMSTATIVAISKFQAENNLEVTGAVTPQLAGMLSAKASPQSNPRTLDPAAQQAAQQACLQERIEAAQAGQKKKRGFGRLMSAVSRTAAQFGNYDISRTAGQVYNASATAADLSAAARDLGITENDIEACQNPG